MSNKDIIETTFKHFNFAMFIGTMEPKMHNVLNANCNFEYPDISKTYKSIIANIGIDSSNYSSFKKALLNFLKSQARSITFTAVNNANPNDTTTFLQTKKYSYDCDYNWQFVIIYGFFPTVSYKLLIDTLKDMYIGSVAHGCRFLPADSNTDLKLDETQFESFVDYTQFIDKIDYNRIDSIVTSKNWYKFIEYKLIFDHCFTKYSNMLNKYIVRDEQILSSRKELIFKVLNQNGEVKITNSYVDSSIGSLDYNGISLFELSILQTLAVGSLKYDPNGSELIGNHATIQKFKALYKKRRPIQILKKLAELLLVLGYNCIILDPTEGDIKDGHELISLFNKNFVEIRLNLEEYIGIILEIGIENAKINVQVPNEISVINTKNVSKVS